MNIKRRIALLTGGGDCPGLNAVIRAIAKKAMRELDAEIIGIEDGFEGLIHKKHRILKFEDVSGILTLGGTILGTSNIANPYNYPFKEGDEVTYHDVSKTVIQTIEDLEVECMVCIGGDGTLNIAHRLAKEGVPIIGIPKTIDNDIQGTDLTFGFDSAVWIATEGIDRLHTTAQSHHRAMIIEVMGRKAGWIALYAGAAGGGDIILIPEISYDINVIADVVRKRNKRGKRFSIIVIAEGAKPKGGDITIRRMVKDGSEPVRLGGVGFVLGRGIEELTGIETRAVVLGHLQRGGSPSPSDRILGTQLGAEAVNMIVNKQFGYMAGVKGNSFTRVLLDDVAKGSRAVPLDHPLISAIRSIGVSFGI
ncbi:MAG: 6-phosphofructokinase [bacterium]